MKVLSYLPDGHVFYHIWGLSFTMYSQWGEQHDFWFRSTDGLCLDTIITNYTVSFSTVPAPDKSGFLSSTARKNGHYGISYFTKDGEVSCASQVGSRAIPGAMYATFDDDGNWLVYTASRTGTVNASSGELDVHKFKPPKSNGGQLEPIGNVKTYGGISPTPIDIAYDSVGKRLWIVSMSSLVYLDEEQDTLLSPTSTNGMVGPEYTSIDVDVHGNLWVGTANQGVFRLTPKNGGISILNSPRKVKISSSSASLYSLMGLGHTTSPNSIPSAFTTIEDGFKNSSVTSFAFTCHFSGMVTHTVNFPPSFNAPALYCICISGGGIEFILNS